MLLALSSVASALPYLCPTGMYFNSQHCEACQANCVCHKEGQC
jgi:hypothetical protein